MCGYSLFDIGFRACVGIVTCHITTGTVTMASHSQNYDMWPCWVQSYLINDICHSLPCVIRNDWMPFPFPDLSSSQVISILTFLSQTWHSMTTMIRLLWLSPSRHTMSCYLWQCNVAVKRGLICQKHDKTGHLQVIYPWWCNLNPDDGDCIHHVCCLITRFGMSNVDSSYIL